MIVNVQILRPEAILPAYHSNGAAGFDFPLPHDLLLRPYEKVLVKLGFAVAVPPNTEMQIRPRSGLSLKTGLKVANSPGTIDEDYRGEIGLLLENTSESEIRFKRGDRVAQGVLAPVIQAVFKTVHELDTTERGSGGLGHTGIQ